MTLDKLVVENFGAYRGKHCIKLTPPSRKRPIVLLGGMNGAGKTTILDALQLVLYGKRARCSNRGSLAYDDFLRQSMNRYADPGGGASIELWFHHVTDGQEQAYRVVRHWHANGNGIKETVDVEVDGQHDPTVAEAWAEYAEEFVPARLAHLFFFDGEKIETLADLSNAAEVLRTGIHSLLGLDLVDRLHDDLAVVAGRKEKLLNVDDTTTLALRSMEAEVLELRSRREELIQAVAGLQGQLEQCRYRLEQVLERLHNEGGELFAQKDLLENNRKALLEEIDGIDSALREVAAGSAPLLLVQDLLVAVQEQARNEARGTQAALLDDILRERDALLLKTVTGLGANTTLQETLAAFLAMDRHERTATRNVPRYLQLSDEATSLIQDLTTVSLPAGRQKISTLLARRKDLSHALTSVERKLGTVPEEDAIAPFEREREELTAKQAAVGERLDWLKEEKQRVEHDLGRKEGALRRLQEDAARSALEQEDLARIIEHAQRSQHTLRAFRERVVERHLARIEESVTESFRHLLRKQALVHNLRIDPRTYALELRDADGNVLLPERLSAGERQLLAVSLVWGLAKASRRPLPAVIDTPLGRLDSSHRRHLVERYFPKASHQVLLLSTDEEIRGEYLECLRPAVGHSYLLQYDETARTSTVQTGYFPKENGNAA
jgi:DNA sulfur modification protein DndD